MLYNVSINPSNQAQGAVILNVQVEAPNAIEALVKAKDQLTATLAASGLQVAP